MEVISLDEYNTVCHTVETLKDGEVLLYTQNKELKGQTSIQMQIGTAVNDYQIASYLPEPEMDSRMKPSPPNSPEVNFFVKVTSRFTESCAQRNAPFWQIMPPFSAASIGRT